MKYTFSTILAVVLILAAFASGFFIGTNRAAVPEAVTSDTPRDVSEAIDFTPLTTVWKLLDENFVSAGEDETSEQERIWGAVEGLASSLGDPYTIFLPPEDLEISLGDVAGNFGGVGMEIGMRDRFLTVIAPLKGTPAERAGIRAGDRITQIDGESTRGITVDKAVLKIRGEQGTSVRLTLAREGSDEPFDVDIVRETIIIPTIETESTEEGVFIIRLFNFSALAPSLFQDALREFVESGRTKLILDLRSNPGGFLESAVDVASWFLPIGKTIVKQEGSSPGQNLTHRSLGYDVIGKVFDDEFAMAVLVNRGTASASEIVAGALSEHGVATLIGENTFGKGSVQQLFEVTEDASVKITVARWLTPQGNTISDGGLIPDIEVESSDTEEESDRVEERAIEFLITGG